MHTYRCQPVTTGREPKGQANEAESLSLAETSNLVLGRALVADAAVWRPPGILHLSKITLPACSGSSKTIKNEQSNEQLLPCRKNTSTCGSSIGRSCSNPAHILNHQFRRKPTHAGVSQWTLKLRKPEFGRHLSLTPCFKKSLNWWCCCLMASRNPVATCRWQERGCLFQVRARMIRALNNWCHAGSKKTCASSMSCQSCQLMWLSCSNPVLIDHQHRTESTHTHAGVSQWPLCENHCLQSLHPRQSSDQRIVSPS